MVEEDEIERGIFFSSGIKIPLSSLVGLIVSPTSAMYNSPGLIVAKNGPLYKLRFLSGRVEEFLGTSNPFCRLSNEVGKRSVEVYSRELGSGFYIALVKELGRSPINLLARMEAQSKDGRKAEYFGKQLRALGELLKSEERL